MDIATLAPVPDQFTLSALQRLDLARDVDEVALQQREIRAGNEIVGPGRAADKTSRNQ